MTLMLAAASICATDALERHLAPPGFQSQNIGFSKKIEFAKKVEKCARPNLDAMSVPEALT